MVSSMITIKKGAHTLGFKTWDFPSGSELGVRLDTSNYRFQMANGNPTQTTVIARIQSHRDFMELVMVTNALAEWDKAPERLVLPYIPNGRQDRVCEPGDAFALLAFARQIAALGYKKLITFDAHSEVTPSVFKALGMDVTVITQREIIGKFDTFNARILAEDKPLFCAPDAGANKRVSDLAGHYGHGYFVRGDKLRDLATGKIKECVVVNPKEEVEGRTVIIVDDLSDAGGTFIGLAKALKAKGAAKVELYVTHGIWSKGTEILLEGGIDRLWSTDSYKAQDANVTSLKLEDVFTL